MLGVILFGHREVCVIVVLLDGFLDSFSVVESKPSILPSMLHHSLQGIRRIHGQCDRSFTLPSCVHGARLHRAPFHGKLIASVARPSIEPDGACSENPQTNVCVKQSV